MALRRRITSTASRTLLVLLVLLVLLAALAILAAGASSARFRCGERWRRSVLGWRRGLTITRVLARRGVAWLIGPVRLRLAPPGAPPASRARRPRPPTRAAQLRLALEELGATFIKLGQILSTRGDLLPAAYQAELARLQDQAPPEPWPVIAGVLHDELGGLADEAFERIDPEPVAAASIGQAHAAVLRGGQEVVVKLRRPGVAELVAVDLAILERAAALAARVFRWARRYDVCGLVRQFGDTLRAELDYRAEAANAERFAAHFATDPTIRIPAVYHQLSTTKVLTLERLRGAKIDDLAALDAAGIDRHDLAVRAATLTLQMVYRDGFFHADPHPGNFFVDDAGVIGLMDFGMVGHLDDATRQSMVRSLLAIVAGDGEGLVDAFVALGFAGAEADRDLLRDDLATLIHDQLGQPLGDVSLSVLLRQLFTLVRRHHLVLPPTLALLAKTIAMNEGLGAQLDPGFHLLDALRAFATSAGFDPPSLPPKPES